VNAPKRRGRRRTPESIRERLEKIALDFPTADVIAQLALVQEQIDLEDELAELEKAAQPVDLEALENEFVKVAASYGTNKGIVYAAWRTMGVPPKVLKAAGIGRI
jgi:hypothetical protein